MKGLTLDMVGCLTLIRLGFLRVVYSETLSHYLSLSLIIKSSHPSKL